MTVRYLEGQKEKLNYFIKNTQYESALKVAKDILFLDQSDSTSYQIVGKIYSLLNSPRQAIENFIRAIELNPKCNLNYISISQSFSAIGENEKGISYFEVDVEEYNISKRKLKEIGIEDFFVPQIFVDGIPIGGFSDLKKIFGSDMPVPEVS